MLGRDREIAIWPQVLNIQLTLREFKFMCGAAHLSFSLRGEVVLLGNIHQFDEVAWQWSPDMTCQEEREKTIKIKQKHPLLLLFIF